MDAPRRAAKRIETHPFNLYQHPTPSFGMSNLHFLCLLYTALESSLRAPAPTKSIQHSHMMTPVTALWNSTATAVEEGQSCWVIGQWQTELSLILKTVLGNRHYYPSGDTEALQMSNIIQVTKAEVGFQHTSPQFLKLREMMTPMWTMAPDFKMPFQSHIFWGQAHQMAQGPGAWPARSWRESNRCVLKESTYEITSEERNKKTLHKKPASKKKKKRKKERNKETSLKRSSVKRLPERRDGLES